MYNVVWNSQNVGKLSTCVNIGYQALFLFPQENLGMSLT